MNLLRASRIITFEPPPGVKANLLRTFSAVSSTRMSKVCAYLCSVLEPTHQRGPLCLQEPAERARLYFLLAWFHALVQERLHYSPLGWAKKYEFNESDLRMACDTLDTWLDMVSQVSDACEHTYSTYVAAIMKAFSIDLCKVYLLTK